MSIIICCSLLLNSFQLFCSNIFQCQHFFLLFLIAQCQHFFCCSLLLNSLLSSFRRVFVCKYSFFVLNYSFFVLNSQHVPCANILNHVVAVISDIIQSFHNKNFDHVTRTLFSSINMYYACAQILVSDKFAFDFIGFDDYIVYRRASACFIIISPSHTTLVMVADIISLLRVLCVCVCV